MTRTEEMTAAASMVDLRDPDLLALAKAELPPRDAVRDLMRRYPGAFGPPQAVQAKHVSQMTKAEYEAARRTLTGNASRRGLM